MSEAAIALAHVDRLHEAPLRNLDPAMFADPLQDSDKR
jgi:hypothetical protein